MLLFRFSKELSWERVICEDLLPEKKNEMKAVKSEKEYAQRSPFREAPSKAPRTPTPGYGKVLKPKKGVTSYNY